MHIVVHTPAPQLKASSQSLEAPSMLDTSPGSIQKQIETDNIYTSFPLPQTVILTYPTLALSSPSLRKENFTPTSATPSSAIISTLLPTQTLIYPFLQIENSRKNPAND